MLMDSTTAVGEKPYDAGHICDEDFGHRTPEGHHLREKRRTGYLENTTFPDKFPH